MMFACNPASGSCYTGPCANNTQCANSTCNVRNGRCR
jgi:hypothetical protein